MHDFLTNRYHRVVLDGAFSDTHPVISGVPQGTILALFTLMTCLDQLPVMLDAKQKHLGCKKGEANQKQQLSDYGYISILATKNFDIKLRPRIS